MEILRHEDEGLGELRVSGVFSEGEGAGEGGRKSDGERDGEGSGPQTLPGISTVVELAKSLLYSGSPEQALELYVAYYESFVAGKSEGCEAEAVVPNARFAVVAMRSLLELKDLQGALRLLRACSQRLGSMFDADSKSVILGELARASAAGLEAALDLRKAMLAAGERMSSSAYASLLYGAYTHGLKPLREGPRLLLGAANEERELSAAGGASFRLTPKEAEALAQELMLAYRTNGASSSSSSANKAARRRVACEYLRVLFRVGVRTAGPLPGSSLDFAASRATQEREDEALAGINRAARGMAEHELGWDIDVADVLVDECLLLGDVSSVQFIVAQMNVKNLYARASTFNAVLRRYAETGDAESALALVRDMAADEHSRPNDESYALLLQACARTTRGRFLARDVLEDLASRGALSKPAADRWLELALLSSPPPSSWEAAAGSEVGPLDVLALMAADEALQPDADTVVAALGAFRQRRDWQGAMRLYKMQRTGEVLRRADADAARSGISSSSSSGNSGSSGKEGEVSMALPPTQRRTVHCLLELLRDMGRHDEAAAVLLDQCRAWQSRSDSSSSRLVTEALFCPDATAFSLVLEACVFSSTSTSASDSALASAAHRSELALRVFSDLEKHGLAPDRRIYAALTQAFSLRGDVPSALGVFDESLRAPGGGSPDVAGLQSVLSACLSRPEFLRSAVLLLERLERDLPSVDLSVYCGDVLLQGFSDSRGLGAALVAAEAAAASSGFQPVLCPLHVLSVLVKARVSSSSSGKKGAGALSESHLREALLFLGTHGIMPDESTMDYFRAAAADAPKDGAHGSSHYNKKLLPHATRKQRSLLDLDEFHDELIGKHEELGKRGREMEKEPYFESGRAGSFDKQVAALKQRGSMDSDDYDDDDGVAHLSEEERLSLAEAALLWAAEDDDISPALRPIEINEAFLTQRSPLRRR